MNQNKGIFLVLSTAVISGFAIFINQFGVKVISSDIYTFFKNLVAGILVVAVLVLLREWREVKGLRIKDWGLLALIGLVGGSVPFLLFFKGLSISTAGNGALIHKTMFLFVAVLAIIFLKEKLNRWLISGILAMLIGNVLLLKFNTEVIWGRSDLLILIATFLWSVENIISKKAVSGISPRIVAAGRMVFGCFFMLIYLFSTRQLSHLIQLNFSQISWVLVTGLILSLYLITWYSGIKYINISTACCLLALGAPITTILTLFQGKAVALGQFFGIFLLVLGVIMIVFLSKTRSKNYEKL